VTQAGITKLPDQTVVLVLQELGQELPMGGDIGSEDDARLALASLLRAAGAEAPEPEAILVSEADAVRTGRRLLALMAEDPDTAQLTRATVDDPPADEQMSVELAVTAAVVLAAMIGWLQTKIDLKVVRKEGRTDVEFRVHKQAAGDEVLQSIAQAVAGLFRATPGSPDDPSA
jgi:hypothetical protein